MNIQNYRERKDAGTVELKSLGGGQHVIFGNNFDPTTGKQLPTTKADVTLEAVKKERETYVKQIEAAQELVAEFDALIADMEDAEKNFETGAEILGKKQKTK